MKSSYDKRMVLEQILARDALSVDGEEDASSRRSPGMSSDYDRREVLTAYIARFGVEPALREPFFAAVRVDHVELRPPRSADGAREEGSPATARCRTPCSTPSGR